MELYHTNNESFLLHVFKRFPRYKEKINQLAVEDEDFRSLCQDYDICLRTLWEKEKQAVRDSELIEEYEELCKVLENDILLYLEKVG